MKIVVSVDSFKGSLESIEAGEIIRQGILEEIKEAEVIVKPLADGGEGTVSALVTGLNGKFIEVEVTGPIGEKILAKYGVVGEKAIIEMATSSGLTLVEKEKRNPMNTTTFGLGEIIKDALNKGYREFIIGIGGSATNDIGLGMLTSLGYEFLDENGNKVGIKGKDLKNITSIDDSKVDKRIKEANFEIACDVDNPLFGPNGAASVYGPQKGAGKEDIEKLDKWARGFSEIVKEKYGKSYEDCNGVGAAGGLGYAFKTFLGGNLLRGVDIITEFLKLEDDIKNANLVITGEGQLDYQTMMGKAPSGVAKIANKYKVPVIAMSGALGKDVEKINEEGIDAYFSITPCPVSLEKAMEGDFASKNLKDITRQIIRVYKINL
ncbi:glycerate kinase [Miniphocaeibacter halophilus]|uniref:Glycerate kinase n=1 Tax=Miniphocaeibacter halophilus TaxID=2931922 RepID=A0AC61MRR6_9FIRM|nr:glycerate kinase [Miniphocaeibacter halophilus]QQK08360.1 glycerate kinase [Miniphocaeibacter halophilus]